MKRIVSTVLAALLLICCLSSCGANVSSDYVSYGEDLIVLLDDYLDAKQTASDIKDDIAAINSRVQLLIPEHTNDEIFAICVDTIDLSIGLYASYESAGLSLSSEDYYELVECRNEIAEYVGIKSR